MRDRILPVRESSRRKCKTARDTQTRDTHPCTLLKPTCGETGQIRVTCQNRPLRPSARLVRDRLSLYTHSTLSLHHHTDTPTHLPFSDFAVHCHSFYHSYNHTHSLHHIHVYTTYTTLQQPCNPYTFSPPPQTPRNASSALQPPPPTANDKTTPCYWLHRGPPIPPHHFPQIPPRTGP